MYPEDLKYSSEHEWVRSPGETDGSVRIGITHYAQDALGDIVFVSLPEVGAEVSAGETVGELESTKSVSDVYAPVSGKVVARNDALDGSPELVRHKWSLFLELMRYAGFRALTSFLAGKSPGPESSIGKVHQGELNQRIQHFLGVPVDAC